MRKVDAQPGPSASWVQTSRIKFKVFDNLLKLASCTIFPLLNLTVNLLFEFNHTCFKTFAFKINIFPGILENKSYSYSCISI